MENKQHLESVRARIFENISLITQCLASPARLRILQILSHRPCTVETISKRANESIANTSQHLQKLLKAGIVVCDKQGVSRVYQLANDEVIETWLSLQRLAGELNLQIQNDERVVCPPELMTDMEISQVIKLVKSEKALLIDVREEEEALNTPAPHSIHLSADKFEKSIKDLPKSKTIFVFCRGRYCSMANPVVEILRKKGYRAFRLRETSYQLKQKLSKT